MTRVRATLYGLLLGAFVIKVLWWTVEPAVPFLAIAFVLIVIYSVIFRRKW